MIEPVAILQRLAVIHSANLPLPADLAQSCAHWLAEAAAPILSGEPVDLALGLRPRPGARSVARATRQARRDTLMAELFSSATGSGNRRADSVLGWLEGSGSIPENALPTVRAVLDAGLPIPTDARTVQRAAARVRQAGAVIHAGDCETVSLEAPPVAAIEQLK